MTERSPQDESWHEVNEWNISAIEVHSSELINLLCAESGGLQVRCGYTFKIWCVVFKDDLQTLVVINGSLSSCRLFIVSNQSVYLPLTFFINTTFRPHLHDNVHQCFTLKCMEKSASTQKR